MDPASSPTTDIYLKPFIEDYHQEQQVKNSGKIATASGPIRSVSSAPTPLEAQRMITDDVIKVEPEEVPIFFIPSI